MRRRTARCPSASRLTKYEPGRAPIPEENAVAGRCCEPVPTPVVSSTGRPDGSTTTSRQRTPAGTLSTNFAPPRDGFGATHRRMRGPVPPGPGAPSVPGIVYHGAVAASRRTNASRLSATFARPVADGWVPSLELSSLHAHVRPSERGFKPSAQRYGPHDSHGATTGPFAGS